MPSGAHKFSYVLHKGPIPEGKLVCHTCDVPRCVNPDHLWLGTHQDNSDDAVSKGRTARLVGPANPMFGVRRVGSANSMFGKRGAFWVTDGVTNLLIPLGGVAPHGFVRGRFVNWSKRKLKNVP